MEWLNYHHLLYFWTVARSGSIQEAARQLRVSPPAISAQIKLLEDQLGEKLLTRSGRRLVMTDMGRVVFSYAEDIFTLGRELVDVVRNRPIGRPVRLDVGIVDVMPKAVVQALLEPALHLRETVRIVCREAASDQLLGRLATHELDVVLSDSPVDPNLKIRAYSHLLGESGVTFAATKSVAARFKRAFPKSLNGAPMLLPTENTALRRNLDFWFETNGIRPVVVCEFEDYALLRAFGEAGSGVFPLPSVVEGQLSRHRGMRLIGRTSDVQTQFYAITAERKLQHPAVVAISNAARHRMFK